MRVALERRADRRYTDSPLCEMPLAPAAEYRRIWAEAKNNTYPVVDRYEQACGATIDSAWFHALALLTQVSIKQSAICYQHGRLLYAALARYTRHARVNT